MNIQIQNKFRFVIQRNDKRTKFKFSFKNQINSTKNANTKQQIFSIKISKNSLKTINSNHCRFKQKRVLINSNNDDDEFINEMFTKSKMNVQLIFMISFNQIVTKFFNI